MSTLNVPSGSFSSCFSWPHAASVRVSAASVPASTPARDVALLLKEGENIPVGLQLPGRGCTLAAPSPITYASRRSEGNAEPPAFAQGGVATDLNGHRA